MTEGRLVPVHDTRLYVEERGDPSGVPLLVLHGGPGLDSRQFGDYLDPLAADGRWRLVLVDQRAQGRSERTPPPPTCTLHQMASDVSAVAADLGVDAYAVLGHGYGGLVALQHAVDGHGAALGTVVSGAVPGMALGVGTRTADLPALFADPAGPRLEEYRLVGAPVTEEAPPVHVDRSGLSDQALGRITQPVLCCVGRHDRLSPVADVERLARAVPRARLVVFEESGHLPFVEETDRYLRVVREFLDTVLADR